MPDNPLTRAYWWLYVQRKPLFYALIWGVISFLAANLSGIASGRKFWQEDSWQEIISYFLIFICAFLVDFIYSLYTTNSLYARDRWVRLGIFGILIAMGCGAIFFINDRSLPCLFGAWIAITVIKFETIRQDIIRVKAPGIKKVHDRVAGKNVSRYKIFINFVKKILGK